MTQSTTKSWKIKITALLLAGVVVISTLVFWNSRKAEVPLPPGQAAGSASSNGTYVQGSTSEKQSIDDQNAVAAAVLTAKSISGTATGRPDFVTVMEWQMLQSVAQRQPNSREKLTNLVNRLLFIKKRTAWESSEENTTQRSELARQLLEMLPEQVTIETLDAASAKEMEANLRADLRAAQL